MAWSKGDKARSEAMDRYNPTLTKVVPKVAT